MEMLNLNWYTINYKQNDTYHVNITTNQLILMHSILLHKDVNVVVVTQLTFIAISVKQQTLNNNLVKLKD